MSGHCSECGNTACLCGPDRPGPADQQERMTTYSMADPGELVGGEFSHVMSLDFFDGDDEPSELIREVWQLVRRDRITFNPSNYSAPCEACETEGELDGNDCPECDGNGYLEVERVVLLDD